MLHSLLAFVPSMEHAGFLGYWFVFGASCAEAVAFFGALVPGTTIVILMGGFAAHGWYDLYDMMFFAVMGAILGDTISFEMGHYHARFLQSERMQARFIAKGKKFFHRFGWLSITFGRFFGPVRGIVPYVAGMSTMSRPSFYLANVMSAIAWSIVHVGLGYILGSASEASLHRTGWAAEIFAGIVIIIGIVIWWCSRERKEVSAAVIEKV